MYPENIMVSEIHQTHKFKYLSFFHLSYPSTNKKQNKRQMKGNKDLSQTGRQSRA